VGLFFERAEKSGVVFFEIRKGNHGIIGSVEKSGGENRTDVEKSGVVFSCNQGTGVFWYFFIKM
jgi:hypothetical protein